MISKKKTMTSFLLFGMDKFKNYRDWMTMKAVPDCTQSYGNGVNPNLQRDCNNADARFSRLMHLIHCNTAY